MQMSVTDHSISLRASLLVFLSLSFSHWEYCSHIWRTIHKLSLCNCPRAKVFQAECSKPPVVRSFELRRSQCLALQQVFPSTGIHLFAPARVCDLFMIYVERCRVAKDRKVLVIPPCNGEIFGLRSREYVAYRRNFLSYMVETVGIRSSNVNEVG